MTTIERLAHALRELRGITVAAFPALEHLPVVKEAGAALAEYDHRPQHASRDEVSQPDMVTDAMVEAAARAIHEHWLTTASGSVEKHTFDHLPLYLQDFRRATARAALKAKS